MKHRAVVRALAPLIRSLRLSEQEVAAMLERSGHNAMATGIIRATVPTHQEHTYGFTTSAFATSNRTLSPHSFVCHSVAYGADLMTASATVRADRVEIKQTADGLEISGYCRTRQGTEQGTLHLRGISSALLDSLRTQMMVIDGELQASEEGR